MYEKIPLSLIRLDPDLTFREREEYQSDSLEFLRKSIQRQDLIHPLLVQKSDNSEYRLIAGQRRYHALQQLAKESGKDLEVMVNIKPAEMPERDRLKLVGEENEMRKGFSQKEMSKYLKAMDKAGFATSEIAPLLGKKEEAVAKLMKVIRDDFFSSWVLEGIVKYSQASKLMTNISEDKHDQLKDTLRKWKVKTDHEIADITRRYDDKKKKPPKAKTEHSNYLYPWLVDQWISDIEKAIEPSIDSEWSYPLMYEPDKRMTSIPSVKLKYDTDSITKLADVLFNLDQECKRLAAEIELRKQREETLRNQTGERSISRDEFLRKMGLVDFVKPQNLTPDTDIPDDDLIDDDPGDEDVQDVADLLDEPDVA